MDLLDRMLGHDRWTTALLLEMCRGLTDVQLDQPFDIGHRTLRRTFGHMISAVRFWTAAMTGQPEEMREDERALAVLSEEHERSYAAFAALARRMHDEGRMDETFIDWYGWPKSIGGTILNVPLHNERHRGDVLHILQRLGVSGLPDGDPQEWEYATKVVEPIVDVDPQLRR
ncbi:MAG TPA: DinB family protein [Thermomicrobiales bacterium]|nr:DinB family protein [Thermomicrobiales bacterium]